MGVFITEGMNLRIPAGGLAISIDDEGRASSSITIEVALDVWPYWLDIGVDHASQARAARVELEAIDKDDGKRVAELLNAEFKSSVVGVISAAFAMDAFYASIRRHRDMQALDEDWSKAGTARHSRIFETLRRSYRLTSGSAQIRGVIKELFRLRDLAVHPPADYGAPIAHDVLGVGVEWRFVAFGAPIAVSAVVSTSKIIQHCLANPREAHTDLVAWSKGILERTLPQLERAQVLANTDSS